MQSKEKYMKTGLMTKEARIKTQQTKMWPRQNVIRLAGKIHNHKKATIGKSTFNSSMQKNRSPKILHRSKRWVFSVYLKVLRV